MRQLHRSSHSNAQKSGWENMKSPRKIAVHWLAPILFAAGILPSPSNLVAQDPPPAPVPKVPQDAPAPPPSKSQDTQAPSNQNQSDSQTTLKFAVNYVFLPVTVKDRDGRLVADLTRNEFRVLDDNVEQRIEFFSAEAFPLSVIVLLDNDLKAKDAEQVESSLSAIIAGLSANDEAFVCRFDSNFHPGKGFTREQDKLLTEFHRTRIDETRTSAPPSAAGGVFTSGPTINGQSAASPGAPATPGSTIILGDRTTKA